MADHLSTTGHKSLHYISVVQNDREDTRAQDWGVFAMCSSFIKAQHEIHTFLTIMEKNFSCFLYIRG